MKDRVSKVFRWTVAHLLIYQMLLSEMIVATEIER